MDNKKGKCCGCPAQMSDGNFVTNYQSARNLINKQIKKNNGIGDHHSYRNYLQQNTNKIIAKQTMFLEKNMKCNFNRQEIKVKKPKKKAKKVKKPVTTTVKSKSVSKKSSK